jgi:hypothetical protein
VKNLTKSEKSLSKGNYVKAYEKDIKDSEIDAKVKKCLMTGQIKNIRHSQLKFIVD